MSGISIVTPDDERAEELRRIRGEIARLRAEAKAIANADLPPDEVLAKARSEVGMMVMDHRPDVALAHLRRPGPPRQLISAQPSQEIDHRLAIAAISGQLGALNGRLAAIEQRSRS